MVAEIRPWLAGRELEDYLFPAWGAQRRKPANVRGTCFHDAWMEATKRGEVREGVWNPPNRKIARPQHAFRAGFQAFLRSQGISEEVIDALVGHHGRSVRARHYAGADSLWERMQAAVDAMPPIDWRGPVLDDNVVKLPKKGRK